MIPTRATLPNVGKMAIIRSGAMGDILVATPAVISLRNAYSTAEILLLTSSTGVELADKGRIPVNRCIELPEASSGDGGKWNENGQFIARMREEKFDMVVNFQGRGKTANSFIRKLAAAVTISFGGPDVDQADLSLPYRYYQSEVIRLQELASLAGGSPVIWEPWLRLLRDDLDIAREMASRSGPPPYVVISPFASDMRRNWPIHLYVTVIRELAYAGYTILLSGTSEQKYQLDELNRETGNLAMNTAGNLSIPALAGLIRISSLLIAPDSGPLHLARAVNTPSVGIYWAPNLINWGPLTRSIHRALISWEMQCPVCGIIPNQPYPFEPREHCEHLVSFVRDISPESVLAEAYDILQLTPKKV